MRRRLEAAGGLFVLLLAAALLLGLRWGEGGGGSTDTLYSGSTASATADDGECLRTDSLTATTVSCTGATLDRASRIVSSGGYVSSLTCMLAAKGPGLDGADSVDVEVFWQSAPAGASTLVSTSKVSFVAADVDGTIRTVTIGEAPTFAAPYIVSSRLQINADGGVAITGLGLQCAIQVAR